MLVLSLIVKGNKFQTAQAAANRKIPFVFVREVGPETVGLVSREHESQVRAWFGEPEKRDSNGFSVGTLLLFSEIEDFQVV